MAFCKPPRGILGQPKHYKTVASIARFSFNFFGLTMENFYTPLAEEVRLTLPTNEAAHHLNRAQQTLRLWAMAETGPIRPLRINGRLAWPVASLKKILGGA